MIDKALTEQTDFSNATLAAAHTNAGSVFPGIRGDGQGAA